MFQKFTPLLILALFAVGAYFMVKGMHHATKLSDPKQAKKIKVVTP